MDMKQRLAEYGKEMTRWEKVTYRSQSDSEPVRKGVRGQKSVLFVDVTLLRRMLDPLSLSANRIAYLVMDKCEFGTNLFYSTYDEIGEELSLSHGSVIKGMQEILQVDFMRKVRNGRWMLNPAVGTKCFKEDIGRLHDMYAKQHPYVPKNEKEGSISDETD